MMRTGQAAWSGVKANMPPVQSSEISFLTKQEVSICSQLECVFNSL